MIDEIASKAMAFVAVTPVYSPDGLEIVRRRSKEGDLRFVINHNAERVYYADHALEPFGYVIENIE